jgi:hypothetical protein
MANITGSQNVIPGSSLTASLAETQLDKNLAGLKVPLGVSSEQIQKPRALNITGKLKGKSNVIDAPVRGRHNFLSESEDSSFRQQETPANCNLSAYERIVNSNEKPILAGNIDGGNGG